MFYDVRPGHQWSIVDSSSHISVSFVGGMIIVHRSSNTLTGYTIIYLCHVSFVIVALNPFVSSCVVRVLKSQDIIKSKFLGEGMISGQHVY